MRYSLIAILLLFAHVSPSHAECRGNDLNLCLQGQRFQISVTWSDFTGHSGNGTAVSLTPDTGYFWFFSPTNVELIIKVLDGHAVNGNFWVFYGALSNVAYTISVKDTSTGQVKQYNNPAGQFASFADTSAFLSDSRSNEILVTKALNPRFTLSKHNSETAPSGACNTDETALCLNGGRFRISATWRDFEGHVGQARAVSLTGDTGYFWFFSPSNVELVVKALDGRPVNSKLWLFYGALSNVEYAIEVADTQTGVYKVYHNTSGSLASVADTSAFDDHAEAAASAAANYDSYLQTLDDRINPDLSLSAPGSANLFWGLSDPAKAILSCLRRAATSATGATCQGFDPQTAAYVPVTVSPEEARRLGALLAVDASETASPAFAAPADKARSLLFKDTSELTPCSLSGDAIAILYGACQVAESKPAAIFSGVTAMLCVKIPGIYFISRPTCLALLAVDLSLGILKATECSTQPLYITKFFARPEDPINLGFDDAKNFDIIGNFESHPKAGSAFALIQQIIGNVLSAFGLVSLPEEVLDPILNAIIGKIGDNIPLPKTECSAPLSSYWAEGSLQVVQGGDVSVNDRTISSGERESWGYITPSFTGLAPWPYISPKATRFNVARKNCSGSGRYKLETFKFPTTGGPSEFSTTSTSTIDACDGSSPSHSMSSQTTGYAYPGLSASYPIFRCDGKWVSYDIENSSSSCTGVPSDDSCSGTSKQSTTFDNGVLTWRDNDTRNVSTPDQVDEFDIVADQGTYDFSTGDNILNFSSETRLYTQGGDCLSVLAGLHQTFLFHVPAEEPTCRMVDQCP